MGGHAFSRTHKDRLGLFCPRLPLAVYEAVRDETVDALKEFFEHVVVPFEHPEKTDFGDIDMVICEPKGDLTKLRTMQELKFGIAKALKTDRFYSNAIGVGYFAVKVPKAIIDLEKITQAKESDEQIGSDNEYWVQVDIEVVDAPSQLNWRVFQNAHSTFCNILRFGLRPAGFVIKSSGFYVEMDNAPKQEKGEKRSPLIYLSNDVTKVLRFLGLDPKRYNRPFDTTDQYWKYATSAKYLSRALLKPGQDSTTDLEEITAVKPKHKGLQGLSEYIGRRIPWANFVDLWLPAHPAIGSLLYDNHDVFLGALAFFNSGNSPCCFNAYHIWEDERAEAKFWEEVNKRLPDVIDPKPTKRYINEVVLAAKRWVEFKDIQGRGKVPTIRDGPTEDDIKHVIWLDAIKADSVRWITETHEGGFSFHELCDWVLAHAVELREKERGRTRGDRRAADARKLERKLQEAMRVSVLGKLICGTTAGLKKVLIYILGCVDKAENWWKMKQDVYVWKPESPTGDK